MTGTFIPTPTCSEAGDEAGNNAAGWEHVEKTQRSFAPSVDDDGGYSFAPSVEDIEVYSLEDLRKEYDVICDPDAPKYNLPYWPVLAFAKGVKDCEGRPYGTLELETQLLKNGGDDHRNVMARIAFCFRDVPVMLGLDLSCMCLFRITVVLHQTFQVVPADDAFVAANPPDYMLEQRSGDIRGSESSEREPRMLRVMLGYALQLDMQGFEVINLRVRQLPVPKPRPMRYIKVVCKFPFTVAIER
jgi:hypothetical protein